MLFLHREKLRSALSTASKEDIDKIMAKVWLLGIYEDDATDISIICEAYDQMIWAMSVIQEVAHLSPFPVMYSTPLGAETNQADEIPTGTDESILAGEMAREARLVASIGELFSGSSDSSGDESAQVPAVLVEDTQSQESQESQLGSQGTDLVEETQVQEAQGAGEDAGAGEEAGPAGDAGAGVQAGPAGDAGAGVQAGPAGEAGAGAQAGAGGDRHRVPVREALY